MMDDGDKAYIYTPVLLILIIKNASSIVCPGRIESWPVGAKVAAEIDAR